MKYLYIIYNSPNILYIYYSLSRIQLHTNSHTPIPSSTYPQNKKYINSNLNMFYMEVHTKTQISLLCLIYLTNTTLNSISSKLR